MNFTSNFLSQVVTSMLSINENDIDRIVDIIAGIEGRLFVIGSGGGSGNASHAVCDFRKLCNIEAYNPYDNIPELTARANDEGFSTTIVEWLKVSRLNENDCLFVLSVGGGRDKVSENIIEALNYAKEKEAKIIGIVGTPGGETKRLADVAITIDGNKYITPIVEGLQSLLLHLIVSNPKLAINKTKW